MTRADFFILWRCELILNKKHNNKRMPQPGKVLNYSKWDNIEISDDEDKVPASIEKGRFPLWY